MQIGSRGWQHRTWLGSFYPDDLPSDWQLPFYSNEFDTVLIPSSELLNNGHEQIQEWLDDSHDNFSFFVEFDSRQELSAQFQLALLLQPQLSGLVLNTPVNQLSLTPKNFSVLATETLGQDIQLYAPDSTEKGNTSSDNTQLVYDIRSKTEQNRRFLGLLRSNTLSTKALKDLLGVLHKTDGGCEALFFAGSKPEIEMLRQAATIYELSY